MCNKKECSCSKEFDAEEAHKRLRKKVNDLSEIVVKYISEAGTTDRSLRVESAKQMADRLIRIVGGSPVADGEFPDCCLVGTKNGNGTLDWFCTGVLVHPRIVVTAGHCFKPGRNFIVALNTVSENSLSAAEIIPVKKAVQHPGFQQTGKVDDITVLVLSLPAQTTPAPMASSADINSANEVKLVGFGNDDIKSTAGFGIKREVNVEIKSIRRSATDNLQNDESLFDFDADLEFVAGGDGFDSCNGDSGGPAYINMNGAFQVAGLTSRSTANHSNPCGDGGIYTRIDVYAEFIKSLIPA